VALKALTLPTDFINQQVDEEQCLEDFVTDVDVRKPAQRNRWKAKVKDQAMVVC
jgi:hypothetical protein